MKKRSLFVLFLISILSLLPVVVSAKTYAVSGNNLSDSNEYDHSMFFAGNKVDLNAKVNGISFVAGQDATVEGKSEYALVAGNFISIKGEIEKDLFLAGNSIDLEGAKITRSAFVVGSIITAKNTEFNGDLFIGGSSVEISDTKINGDVTIEADTIKILDNVEITGKLKYSENANTEIKGEYDTETYKTLEVKTSFKDILVNRLVSMASLLLVGIIIYLLFPKVYKKLDEKADALSVKEVFKSLGFGAIVLIGVPIAAVFALFTIIGVPVTIIGLICYGIFIYLSTLVVSYIVGKLLLEKVFKKGYNFYLSLLIGIVVIYLLKLIPILGSIISLIVLLVGLGYLFRITFSKKNA